MTLIVQEDNDATELPQVSVAANGDAREIPDRSSGPLPPGKATENTRLSSGWFLDWRNSELFGGSLNASASVGFYRRSDGEWLIASSGKSPADAVKFLADFEHRGHGGLLFFSFVSVVFIIRSRLWPISGRAFLPVAAMSPD